MKLAIIEEVFWESSTIKEVNKAYEKAVKRGKKDGFTPVLVISDETLAEWLDIFKDEENYSIEETLADYSDNGEEILKSRYDDYKEDIEYQTEDGEPDLEEFMDKMENGDKIMQLDSFQKYTGDGIEETILFEIPTEIPWKVFAWFPMGGWNECTDRVDQCTANGTLGEVADSIRKSNVWFFWWD